MAASVSSAGVHSDISSISPLRTPDFRLARAASRTNHSESTNENTLHAYTGRHCGYWLGLGDFVDQRARTATPIVDAMRSMSRRALLPTIPRLFPKPEVI
jgi:hypothetical protein